MLTKVQTLWWSIYKDRGLTLVTVYPNDFLGQSRTTLMTIHFKAAIEIQVKKQINLDTTQQQTETFKNPHGNFG